MENNEYVLGALRTEAPIESLSIPARFTRPETLRVLLLTMFEAVEHGDKMNKLKRHLFYGTELKRTDISLGQLDDEGINNFSHIEFTPSQIRLLHAAIGFYTEASEIVHALFDSIFSNLPFDPINLVEEGGDIFWYMAIFCNTLGVTFEDVMVLNNAKLKARFPDRFSEDCAIQRDLGQERAVLEQPDTYQQLIAILINQCWRIWPK